MVAWVVGLSRSGELSWGMFQNEEALLPHVCNPGLRVNTEGYRRVVEGHLVQASPNHVGSSSCVVSGIVNNGRTAF